MGFSSTYLAGTSRTDARWHVIALALQSLLSRVGPDVWQHGSPLVTPVVVTGTAFAAISCNRVLGSDDMYSVGRLAWFCFWRCSVRASSSHYILSVPCSKNKKQKQKTNTQLDAHIRPVRQSLCKLSRAASWVGSFTESKIANRGGEYSKTACYDALHTYSRQSKLVPSDSSVANWKAPHF